MKQIHVAALREGVIDINENIQKYTIKELRARKNVTQKTVAQELGVSLPTYNAWEKDVSNVPVSKFERMARYFGVKMTDIFIPST